MNRIWPYIYAALFVIFFLLGVGVLGKDYGNTNVNWILVSVVFVISLVFPPWMISSARLRTRNRLPRASFSRAPSISWWADPLQCLRTGNLLLGGYVLGSLITLPRSNSQGVMCVWLTAAMLLGFLIGEFVALKKFRGSIT
jgi:hypothetical protein